MEFCNCNSKSVPSYDGESCEVCGKWFESPKPVKQGTPAVDLAELETLLNDAEAVDDAQRLMRERYGSKKGGRTRLQLANLVADCGYMKVCHFENITPAQLRKRLNASFSDQLKEKFRQQNLKRING